MKEILSLCVNLLLLMLSDAVPLKIIAGDRNVIKKDGATHTISKYYVVPNDFDPNKVTSSTEETLETSLLKNHGVYSKISKTTNEVQVTEARAGGNDKSENSNVAVNNNNMIFNSETKEKQVTEARVEANDKSEDSNVAVNNKNMIFDSETNGDQVTEARVEVNDKSEDNNVSVNNMKDKSSLSLNTEPAKAADGDDANANESSAVDMKQSLEPDPSDKLLVEPIANSYDLNSGNTSNTANVHNTDEGIQNRTVENTKQNFENNLENRLEALILTIFGTAVHKSSAQNLESFWKLVKMYVDTTPNQYELLAKIERLSLLINIFTNLYDVAQSQQSIESMIDSLIDILQTRYVGKVTSNRDDSETNVSGDYNEECVRKCSATRFQAHLSNPTILDSTETVKNIPLVDENRVTNDWAWNHQTTNEDITTENLPWAIENKEKENQPWTIENETINKRPWTIKNKVKKNQQWIIEDETIPLTIENKVKENQPWTIENETINTRTWTIKNKEKEIQPWTIEYKTTPLTIENKVKENQQWTIEAERIPLTIENKVKEDQPWTIENETIYKHPWTIKNKVKEIQPWTTEDEAIPLTIENKAKENQPWTIENETIDKHPWTIKNKVKEIQPWTIEDETVDNRPWTIKNKVKGNQPWTIEDETIPWTIENKVKAKQPWTIEDKTISWTIKNKVNENQPWTIKYETIPLTIEDKAKQDQPWTIKDKVIDNIPWIIKGKMVDNRPWTVDHRTTNKIPWTIEDKVTENIPWTIQGEVTDNISQTIEENLNPEQQTNFDLISRAAYPDVTNLENDYNLQNVHDGETDKNHHFIHKAPYYPELYTKLADDHNTIVYDEQTENTDNFLVFGHPYEHVPIIKPSLIAYLHDNQLTERQYLKLLKLNIAPSYHLFTLDNLHKLHDSIIETIKLYGPNIYQNRALMKLRTIMHILLNLADHLSETEGSNEWYEKILFYNAQNNHHPLQLYVHDLLQQRWLHELMLVLYENNFNLNILQNPKIFSFLEALQLPSYVQNFLESELVDNHFDAPNVFNETLSTNLVLRDISIHDEEILENLENYVTNNVIDIVKAPNDGVVLSIAGVKAEPDTNAIIEILQKHLHFKSLIEKQEHAIIRDNKIEMLKQIILLLREKGYGVNIIKDLVRKLYTSVHLTEGKHCEEHQTNFTENMYSVILPILRRSGK